MAHTSAAEKLAQEIDPDPELIARREEWPLVQARANLALGYAPERVSNMTGWPVMLLTKKTPAQARKAWEAQVAAEKEAERLALEAEVRAIDSRLDADNAAIEQVRALLAEQGMTWQDVIDLLTPAPQDGAHEPPAEGLGEKKSLADLAEERGIRTDGEDIDILTGKRVAEEPVEEHAPPAPRPAKQVTYTREEDKEAFRRAAAEEAQRRQPPPLPTDLFPDAKVIPHPAKQQRSVDNLVWSQGALDFVETYGMRELIEAAAHYPTTIEIDPHQADVDYPIERRRRGDMQVTIGFRNPREPMILFVHLFTHEQGYTSPNRSSKGGSRQNNPTDKNDLIKRARLLGYTEEYGKHISVKWKDGRVATVVPTTSSDRNSILASWKQLLRWHRENVNEAEALEAQSDDTTNA